MDTDYYFKRHTELWESQNTQIKRILFFGLVVAYILFTNILQPYSNQIDDIKVQMDSLASEVTNVEETTKTLHALDSTLLAIQKTIEQKPWMEEKDKLIRKYAQMNALGSPNWSEYQKEADSTVSKIGAMVLDMVSKPFEPFQEDGYFNQVMPRLAVELNRLPEVVDDWTDENRGERWYLTTGMKEATVQGLTLDLEYQLREISSTIDDEQPELENKINDLKNHMLALDKKKKEAEEKLPEKLDAEMNKILPNWISGIITVNQMMLYPFLIIGIVIYMAVITFELTRHYHIMAKGLNIADAKQSDAALSSLWTLTYRGRLGTFKTLVIYMGFVILMWYFYENGFVIFQKWQNAEAKGMLNNTGLNIALWTGRAILLSVLIAIIKKPFDKKTHPEMPQTDSN